MSASHGCTDNKAVVESFKEALLGRIGADRYQMWFAQGVDFTIASSGVDSHETSGTEQSAADARTNLGSVPKSDTPLFVLRVRGQFALDRLRTHFLREIRGAAMQSGGADVRICLDEPPAEQTDLPLDESSDVAVLDPAKRSEESKRPQQIQRTHRRKRTNGRGKTKPISSLIADGAGTLRKETLGKQTQGTETQGKQTQGKQTFRPEAGQENAEQTGSANLPQQLELPALAAQPAAPSTPRAAMTAASFVQGSSNQLAYTAMVMVCESPKAASPLFLSGPTGTGKTHMLSAIAEQLRRRHRMRRVMHLSAEQFTNDFISSVGNSGIAAFRRRYREVDALLIDDVQFLGSKKATLREMLYTVETLAGAGRPLVFSGLQSPTEIPGLSGELAGRMAAGLVCPVQPLDMATREVIFRRWLGERCPLDVPDEIIEQLNPILAGDGRVISGVVNMINTLQRMEGKMPTMDQLRRYGGDLIRAAKPLATLAVIEIAVCETFHLPAHTLRGRSQTRAITQPRMLAMYLSRQLTSSAYAEIARHFGGKSHSTAISAEQNVKSWLEKGQAIGRGPSEMSAQEAIDRIESLLRSG